jgi:hypothetical protein
MQKLAKYSPKASLGCGARLSRLAGEELAAVCTDQRSSSAGSDLLGNRNQVWWELRSNSRLVCADIPARAL